MARVSQLPAFEFRNLEGKKISTSRNWAVWVHEYLDEMPGKEDELKEKRDLALAFLDKISLNLESNE